VWYGKSEPRFVRNIVPPSSGLKSKASQKAAGIRRQNTANCMLKIGFHTGWKGWACMDNISASIGFSGSLWVLMTKRAFASYGVIDQNRECHMITAVRTSEPA
jgi:hypothetical protein